MLIETKSLDLYSFTLLCENGADVNRKMKYLEQEKCEKSEEAKLIDNPREEGYESGLVTFSCEISPLGLAVKLNNISAVLLLHAFKSDRMIPIMRGDESLTFEEFCVKNIKEENNLMKLAVKGCWTPELNRFYPRAFSVILETILLCFNRQQDPKYFLPKEIAYNIFKYLSHYPVSYELMLQYK